MLNKRWVELPMQANDVLLVATVLICFEGLGKMQFLALEMK
jgi:hypothetical protein